MASDSAINIFLSVLAVMFVLSVFTPVVKMAFNDTTITSNDQELTKIFEGSSYLTIGLNVTTCMFWTFGLPAFFNYILIIPRIIGLMSLYYIIFPTK